MSRYWKVNLIIGVLTIILSLAVGIVVESFIQSSFKQVTFNVALLLQSRTLIISGLTALLFLLFLAISDKGDLLKKLGKSKSIDVGLENSHFMTKKEITKNFSIVSFENLHNAQSGIVVSAEEKASGMNVTITSGIHTLVIGNTGSGKTAAFISPNIQIMSHFKDKPSMIIADPKGELFEKHSKTLSEQGYKIQIIDLINPLRSTRWNPLSPIYERYQYMLKLGKDKLLEKQEIADDTFDQLNELVKCIFKANERSHEKMWEQGMQNFILAVLLALLEDSEDERNGMTKEKFNFANVRTICSQTQNECDMLKEFFYKREMTSNAKMLASGVLDTSDRTLQSYFTTISQAMTTFADQGICAFMSENEIDFANFDEAPTALFLKIPDERQSRYNIASAFFANTYRELVGKARRNKNGELKRPLYFIIDEFGNLPPVPGIDKMLAVSRSRKIFFTLVLQSYEQLENVYGKVAGDIVRGNCNIEVFIGAKESGTLEAFSRKCGNYTVTSSSVSQGVKSDGNANTSVRERPLIYPTDLAKLNNPPKVMGNAIVLVSGKMPMRSKFTPDFKCKRYHFGQFEIVSSNKKLFNVKENFYNFLGTQGIVAENDIPEEIIERASEEVAKEVSKTQEKTVSSQLSKYLKEYEIANSGVLNELLLIGDFDTVLDLIQRGIKKAKEQENNFVVNILNKEFNLYKRTKEAKEKGMNDE